MIKIKVLHVVNSLNVGGLETIVLDLIDKYSDNIDSYVLCLEGEGILASDISSHKVTALNRKPGVDLSNILKIHQYLRENSINLIHTHNVAPHFYGSLAGFLSRTPVIHTKHGRNNPKSYKQVLLSRFASFFTKKIIAVSDDSARLAVDHEKINFKKVEKIWNGVDVEKFIPLGKDLNFRKELSISDGHIVLGIVARLCPEKDHITLLNVCRHLNDSGVQYKLLIVGDGPLGKELLDYSKEIGVLNNVHFLGLRKDIPYILSQVDIFCLSSVTEGVPLTLLEAMSCGLPVVATDVGGNAEVVQDGVNGYIVPSGEAKEFSMKIIRLISNSVLRSDFSTASFERARELFSISSVAAQYEDKYFQLLEDKNR